ncbi:MAG: hypothetical protein HXX17_04535 [Geobacteraceae bacterium]|nr:hypothetical protein [Geobacteraceae bacterium]
MERSQFIVHKGKEIYQLDCRTCQPEDYLPIINECAKIVQARPKKSVRTLTIAGGGRFDKETISGLMHLTRDNEPYVIKSAVVGISGLQKIALQTVAAFSKREFRLFDDLEQAKDYLVTD